MDEATLKIVVSEGGAPAQAPVGQAANAPSPTHAAAATAGPISATLTSAEWKQLKAQYGIDRGMLEELEKATSLAPPINLPPSPPITASPRQATVTSPTVITQPAAPFPPAVPVANALPPPVPPAINLQQEAATFAIEMEKLTAALDPQAVRERTRNEVELAKARERVDKAMKAERERIDPKAPEGILDKLFGFMKSIRGTAGGILGTTAGAGLDLASALGIGGGSGGAAGAGAGGLAAAAGPLAAVFLVDKALKALTSAITNTITAVGSFAARLISPDANPAAFVQTIGDMFAQIGQTLSNTIPIIGTLLGGFASAIGAAINAVSSFMRSLDGLVERYAAFSPQLAQAQAIADITQTLADFRRAQQVTPELVRYLQTRTEMQQRFEDAKIRFLTRMMPTALKVMELTEKLLPFVEAIVNILSAIASTLPGIGTSVDDINNTLNRPDLPEFDFNNFLNGFPWQLAQNLGRVPSPQAP